jgi:hypothetical protein
VSRSSSHIVRSLAESLWKRARIEAPFASLTFDTAFNVMENDKREVLLKKIKTREQRLVAVYGLGLTKSSSSIGKL